VPTSATGLLPTYDVASNGRAAIRVGTDYVAAYMVGSNQAFFIAPDRSVLFGFGEAQAAGSFTNTAVTGRYAGLATTPAALGVSIFSGEFTVDGASPTGNLTGVEDIGAPSGSTLGASVNATYSISSSPTNGRGTIAGKHWRQWRHIRNFRVEVCCGFHERSKPGHPDLRTVIFTHQRIPSAESGEASDPNGRVFFRRHCYSEWTK
jgi:hypothetical protein